MEKIRRMRQQLGEWFNIWDPACRLGKLVPERRGLLRKPP